MDFTVLLPVYRGDSPEFFREAYRSVTEQTLPPTEVLIVRDGPVPASIEALLTEFEGGSTRVLRLPQNVGLARALNAGLAQVSTSVVARADADDVCTPDRFERQLPLIEAGADIVGASIDEFETDPSKPSRVRLAETDPAKIAAGARFESPFHHPAVMFRVKPVLAVGGYEDQSLLEDYLLWAKLILAGAKVGNVREVLVHYRVGSGSYGRRGGLGIFRSELALQVKFLRIGFTTPVQFLRNVAIRGGYRLVPEPIRKLAYVRRSAHKNAAAGDTVEGPAPDHSPGAGDAELSILRKKTAFTAGDAEPTTMRHEQGTLANQSEVPTRRPLQHAIETVLLQPARLANWLLPKRDRIVIYSNLGFRDNERVLFEYLVEHGEQREIVVATNEWKKYRALWGGTVKFVEPHLGVWYFLTSRYFFYSFGKYPIPPHRQRVVNLWHGMPLKTIGNLEKPGTITEQYFTNVLATSDFFAGIMARAFNCPREDVLVTGLPRCDELFRPLVPPAFAGHQRLVCWLPTFRRSESRGLIDSTGDVELPLLQNPRQLAELNEALASADTMLLVKFHPLQTLTRTWEDLSHIRFINQSTLDENGTTLYRLLGGCDALITDYSSVFIDYLLLNRPIAFAFDDLDQYRSGRGFVFDNPLEYMPGPHISQFSQLTDFLVGRETNTYADDRARVNQVFNKYTDGNCARLVRAVGL
ncbi:MAG: CDP-glycerol:glycerophosphate glycerophosphotransferase [Propionibacteriaceae bacterium]|jgi:CDP-glycerol glycerophosphotransferase (TagB/SpsB family)/glycosyltransferase involved in cell wall biosynthesis|nr:CDP-glycerol:glycerophosphate glycerophosphotransferase [Propionibacteriaceae bacterium]